MVINDIYTLPDDIPVPEDDGACQHLEGHVLADLSLPATDGTEVNLSKIKEVVVVFAYPRTGQTGMPPLDPDWNNIPGARGCTPQTMGFCRTFQEYSGQGIKLYGLSTQTTEYQKELVERLSLPFPILSDADLTFSQAMKLPTFEVAGQVLLKRLAWVAVDGVIRKVFYPVFPPDKNSGEVLSWLRDNDLSA